MAQVLVVVDEVLQFVGMHHDVKATVLGQPELLAVNAGKAHLLPGAGAGKKIPLSDDKQENLFHSLI